MLPKHNIEVSRFTSVFLNLLRMSNISYEETTNYIRVPGMHKQTLVSILKKIGYQKLDGTQLFFKGDLSVNLRSTMTGNVLVEIQAIKDM